MTILGAGAQGARPLIVESAAARRRLNAGQNATVPACSFAESFGGQVSRTVFMRMRFVIVLTIALMPAILAAQSGAPTRTATPSSPAETATIEAGIKLHDAGKYDEAIAK